MENENSNHVSEGALKSEKHDESFGNAAPPPDHTKDDTEESMIESPNHEAAVQTADAEGPAEEEWVAGFKLVIMLISITLACFLMLLDTSIVATATPRITSQFHSLPDIGWYGSAYLLANCSMTPIAGKLFKRFNTKTTFMTFLALFEIGSLLSAVATSSKMFIVGRAVAGMGAAGLGNGALTIVGQTTPLEKRAVIIGIMMGTAQLGIMFGPLLGGALTEYASWRWCFYINLPAGAVVSIFLFFVRISPHAEKTSAKLTLKETLMSLDLMGFILFAPTAIMFLLALEWGGSVYRWDSAVVIGLFVGSAVLLVVFFCWERTRGEDAMIPLPMITRLVIASSCLAMFFAAANMLTMSYYMAIYFQADRGTSPMLSGVYLLPSILSQMVFGVAAGVGVGRLGYYIPFMAVGSMLLSIATGLLSTLSFTSATGKWVGYQFLGGIGRGMCIQFPILAIQNHLPLKDISIGMSLVMFSQSMGAALWLSFAQTIFSTSLRRELPISTPGIDVQAVIGAGASAFRAIVPKAALPGVLHAYDQANNRVFYLATGAAVATFVVCWGMGWKSVKKAKVVKPEV